MCSYECLIYYETKLRVKTRIYQQFNCQDSFVQLLYINTHTHIHVYNAHNYIQLFKLSAFIYLHVSFISSNGILLNKVSTIQLGNYQETHQYIWFTFPRFYSENYFSWKVSINSKKNILFEMVFLKNKLKTEIEEILFKFYARYK